MKCRTQDGLYIVVHKQGRELTLNFCLFEPMLISPK